MVNLWSIGRWSMTNWRIWMVNWWLIDEYSMVHWFNGWYLIHLITAANWPLEGWLEFMTWLTRVDDMVNNPQKKTHDNVTLGRGSLWWFMIFHDDSGEWWSIMKLKLVVWERSVINCDFWFPLSLAAGGTPGDIDTPGSKALPTTRQMFWIVIWTSTLTTCQTTVTQRNH